MIVIDRVSYAVNGRMILDDISLSVRSGEVFALLGPNGAGKSTLARCLTGEITAYSGSIRWQERDIREWPGAEIAKSRAVLPQHFAVNFPFTSETVIAMGRFPHRRPRRPDRDQAAVAGAAERAHVGSLLQQPVTDLSGGEGQRVHMARAFAQIWEDGPRPRLLVFDEPTASLDLQHQHQTLKGLRGLALDGVTAFCVLHDLNLAAAYCDRIGLLQGDRPAAVGRPSEVLTPAMVRQVFNIDVRIIQVPGMRAPVLVNCENFLETTHDDGAGPRGAG